MRFSKIVPFKRLSRRTAAKVLLLMVLVGGGFLALRMMIVRRAVRQELADVAKARQLVLQNRQWEVRELLTKDGRPRTADGAYALAVAQDDGVKALSWVRLALKIDPVHRQALVLLNRIYDSRHQQIHRPEERIALLREQIQEYEGISKRHPEFAGALFRAAVSKMELHRIKRDPALLKSARAQLERSLKLLGPGADPKVLSRAHVQLGRLESMEAGQAGASKNKEDRDVLAVSNGHLRKAAELNPTSIEPYVELARNYRELANIGGAIAELEAAAGRVKDTHAQSKLWALISALRVENHEPAAAEASIEKSIAADSEALGGYLALADLKAARGQTKEAEQALRKGTQIAPASIDAHLALARFYVATARVDEGIQVLNTVLKTLQPTTTTPEGDSNQARYRAASYLARVYLEKKNDFNSAFVVARYAAKLTQPDPFLLDTMGWLHYRLGDIKRARLILQPLAIQVPKLAVVHYHLAVVHAALGEKNEAIAEVSRALELRDRFAERSDAVALQERLGQPGL